MDERLLDTSLAVPEGFECVLSFDVFLKPRRAGWDLKENNVYPWHEDYIFGGWWPTRWHKLLKYKLVGESDVKVPWELGRGHLFSQMMLGVSSGELPSSVFEVCLDDFIRENPPGYGVQWQCPMDVSIRLVNLMISKMLLNSLVTGESLIKDSIVEQCHVHYNYISRNSEIFNGGLKNNHYLSDLMGKAWYYALVGKDIPACDILLKELEVEVGLQFLSDGGNFEGSTAYHFLSTEIVVLTVSALVQLYRDRGEVFSCPVLLKAIRAAIGFSQASVSSLGYPCRIGDDDSGLVVRPHDLTIVPLNEKNKHIATNRIRAFNRFIDIFEKGGCEDILSPVVMILMGVDKGGELASSGDSQFKKFGLYKYRVRSLELYFRHLSFLGCNGQGGHNHMDDMSLEVFSRGKPVIVDPGTYCYTSLVEKRNHYRNGGSHNAVNTGVDSFEVLKGSPGLFKLVERPGARSIFKVGDGFDEIDSNRQGVVVSRKISYLDGLKVSDRISSGGGTIKLTFYPGLEVDLDGSCISVGGLLKIVLEDFNAVEIIDSVYSDYYLSEQNTRALVISFTGECTMNFIEV